MSNLRTGIQNISRTFVSGLLDAILTTPLAELVESLWGQAVPVRKSYRQEAQTANFGSIYDGVTETVGRLSEENGKFVVRTLTHTYVSSRRRDAIRRARQRGIEVRA